MFDGTDRHPRRLLMALPFLHFGVGRLAIDLAVAAVDAGWAVDFVTCGGEGVHRDDLAMVDEARRLGASIHHADIFSRDQQVMRDSAERLGEICRARRIDLVHAFTAVAAAAGIGHAPVVASVVGWAANKAQWQRRMDAAILDRCAAVTAVSAAVRDELRTAGLRRRDVNLILHGAPLTPARDLSTADGRTPLARIGVMAQLIERKGVDVLIEAVARLESESWSRLLIAGSGDAESELRTLAARQLPPARVEWLGQADVDAFFESIDLLVVPSRADALPLILLRAMAYGIPVIASAVEGIPECVRDGVDGLLVPPGDTAALASALSDTLRDPAAALARARSAKARIAAEFSLSVTLGKYVACYERAALAGLSVLSVPSVAVPSVAPAVAHRLLNDWRPRDAAHAGAEFRPPLSLR